MRWLALSLLAANLALGAYLLFIAPSPRGKTDIAALELNAGQVKVVRSRTGTAGKADLAKAKPGACLEWGGFLAPDLERARAELARAQIENVSVRELDAAPLWLVYIPPLRSRDEAERRVRELDELGIKGARAMTDERWRNGVFLGTFATEAAAVAHQQRMREAKIRNVAIAQRNGARLSVIVIADPTPALAARLVEVKTGFTGTDVRAVVCAAGGT